ncbi:glycoside hydrolase family 71 protein [Bradyrhizobium canariense]|nr:glycoside hydrolase family 71 protein [Bradyrhizobium canariense]
MQEMLAALARSVCGPPRFRTAAQEFVRYRIEGARRIVIFPAVAKDLLALTGCQGLAVAICLTFAAADARAADAALTPSAPSADACLPIDMPDRDSLFSAPKKVFAHYFNRFPLSLDNKEASVDYYATEYLNPEGERGKWRAEGGFLRSRPFPVPVGPNSEYVIENLKREIRLALSRGITGFTFDILALGDIQPGSYLPNMLKAASEVDPRFQIVLMPDMASLGPNTDNLITIIKTLYDQPGLLHFSDGRLVIAPFLSESVSPEAWGALKSQLAQDELKIAFVPTFLNQKYIAKYKAVSDGFGTFGTPLPREGATIKTGALAAHAEGKLFMAGISGQGYRPKEYRYWEAQGSLAYRNSWLGAIGGGADWIQLTTWNDFSESTQVLPYTDRSGSSGTGYFNLTGFYASWFLTGKAPSITHDVLYYFYRRQSLGATAPKAGQQVKNAVFWPFGRDIIEVLGFLKTPGTLEISIGDKNYTKEVDAGIQSFSVPLGAGTPHFSLLRDNHTVISFEGTTPIVGESDLPGGYADLTYWSGSASSGGTCFTDAIRW